MGLCVKEVNWDVCFEIKPSPFYLTFSKSWKVWMPIKSFHIPNITLSFSRIMTSSLSFSSFNSVFYFFKSSITCCKTSFMSNISCQLFCFEISLKLARPSESNTKCVELYFNCVSSCVFKNKGCASKLNWFAEWYIVSDLLWLAGASSALCCGVWLVAGLEKWVAMF